jgi:SAM-dependent methyltransferase
LAVLYHFLLLLTVALACHGRLALDRPAPRYLTEFYLLIAVGGVFGGLFNALAAPLLFRSLIEYPLVMVLACLLVLGPRAAWPRRGGVVARELALALGVTVLAVFLYSGGITARLDLAALARLFDPAAAWLRPRLDPYDPVLNRIIVYGPPLLAALALRRRPLALGLALAGVLVVADFTDVRTNERVRQARSFFGVLQVSHDPAGYNELRHGTTLHGRQSLDPARRREPLSYYSRPGPIGQVFTALDRRGPGLRVAVIGLGSGTVAAYARPGDTMVFYEIDRLVREIAFDPTCFTYVTDARERGAALRVELGDARTRLEAARRQQPGERYDLIVVDAFTSDAIPVHLLTREALRLYLDMLAPRGVVLLHLSNRYLRLEPVVARLAEDAGLAGRLLQHDDDVQTEGAVESTWALLTPTPEALDGLAYQERWMAAELEVEPGVGVWTDDFHNLVLVFKW